MTEFMIVQTTYESRTDATAAAERLVEMGLAACVQLVGPVTSIYRWEGERRLAEEWLCLAKCRSARFDDCRRALERDHPYDTPEIVAVPLVAGSPAYMAWLRDSTP